MYFLRKYKLKLAGTEISEYRINFKVDKSLVGFPNLANIKIYNAPENVKKLLKQGDKIELYAGYENNIGLIFKGEVVNINSTYSKPDYILEIYAGDAHKALTSSKINKTLKAGATTETIYNTLVDNLHGVSKGLTEGLKNCISKKRSLLKAIILSGGVKEWLDKISATCGFDYAVDDGVISTVAKNKALNSGNPFLVSQTTGMLGSPEQTETGMNVTTLLNHSFKLGHTFKIDSISTKLNVGNLMFRKVKKHSNNALYRINSISHSGDNREGEWKSELVGMYLVK